VTYALQPGADTLCRMFSAVQRVVHALDELAVDEPEVLAIAA
jgi:hypothetical protein